MSDVDYSLYRRQQQRECDRESVLSAIDALCASGSDGIQPLRYLNIRCTGRMCDPQSAMETEVLIRHGLLRPDGSVCETVRNVVLELHGEPCTTHYP